MYYLKHLLLALIPGILLGLGGFALFQQIGLLDVEKPERLNAYVILSGSMEPELPVGGVVITQSSPVYQTGDIITFQQGNQKQMVTHRIVGVNQEGGEFSFKTKGDANENDDAGVVLSSQIAGKEVLTIPYIGYAVNFAKTPQGFVALIVIPATIVIYEELKTIGRELMKVIKKIWKRGEGRVGKSDGNKAYWRAAIVFPVAGFVFLVTALSTAFFTDLDESLNNILGVATTYGTTPSPTPNSSPAPTSPPINHVVINEFMAHPIGENEWVELYNPTDSPIDLTGWSIGEGDQLPKDISDLGTIPSKGFVVYQHTSSSWLDNGGEQIVLLDSTNTEVDSFTYTGSTSGQSIGRQNDGELVFVNCTLTSKGTTNNNFCDAP